MSSVAREFKKRGIMTAVRLHAAPTVAAIPTIHCPCILRRNFDATAEKPEAGVVRSSGRLQKAYGRTERRWAVRHSKVNPRLRAMARQCRNRGGNCNCREGLCKAAGFLATEEAIAGAHFAEVKSLLLWVKTPMSTVRPDWVRPVQPSESYRLSVECDGEGWWLHWHDPDTDDVIEIPAELQWPFNEQIASFDDWQRLGIVVV